MSTEILTIPHNLEAEQSVIGGLLLDDDNSERTQKVLSILKPESFYIRAHQVLFAEMRQMYRDNKPVDGLTLFDALESKGITEQVGGFAYLAEISKNTPSAANIVAYAMSVREAAMERFAIQRLSEAVEMLYSRNGMTAAQKYEAIQAISSQLTDHARTGSRRGARPLMDVMEDWLDELEGRFDPNSRSRGLSTGIPSLDALLQPKGLVRGSLLVIGARPKMGKAQPLDSRILLEDGSWTTFKDVQLGDRLASADTHPSTVTGIFPQGERQVYAVTFSDGRVVECADDHLWEIHCSKMAGGFGVVDTERLREMLGCVRYQNRIHVPGISGHFGKKVDLGISPWLLGALLGDGSFRGSVNISMTEPYMQQRVKSELPEGVHLRHINKGDYSLVGGNGIVTSIIRNLGLMGCHSETKFIPEIVFTADRETRLALLCGLLETDGWQEGGNCLRYSSASQALADGIQRLVQSLGGVCRRTVKATPKYRHAGELRMGLPAYVCAIRLSDELMARIKSPRVKFKSGARVVKTSDPVILSVEPIGRKECVCIMVSHPRHLYATDGYILTHNTTFYSQLAINCALQENLPAVMFSLEMPDKQIFERMVGQLSGVNTDIFYRGADDESEFSHANARALQMAESGNFFIDDTPGVSFQHIQSEARRIKRENGRVGMVLVDYLTLMTAEKADRNDLAYGLITKGLKNLAKELDCVVVLLTQLNRDLEKRTNKRPLPSDSRDTGQIEQDCDYWIGIYRVGAYDETANQSETELLLRLNRHGQSGVIHCEQRNGSIYDCDQETARRRTQEREEKPNKRGGF